MADPNPALHLSAAGATTMPAIDFDDYEASLRGKTTAELRAASLVLRTIESPWLMRVGTTLARLGLALHVPGTERAIEATVFQQFCGGTSLTAAFGTAERLAAREVRTILDYAVECEHSEAGFDRVREQLLDMIERAATRSEVAFCAVKISGLCSTSLLAKRSAGASLSAMESAALERANARLEAVVASARHRQMPVFIDAEHSWVQPAIDEMVLAQMRRHNRGVATVHTTVQLYLHDRLAYLDELIADARDRGYVLGVKLVRGAYLEQEAERAAERGYPSPLHPSKAATDAAFDSAIDHCLDAIDTVEACVATHNAASVRHLLAEMSHRQLARGDRRITISQLLGMLDRITFPLAAHGYNALKYVPYGEVRSAFPYLLRRADENRSVASQIEPELKAIRAELERRGKHAL